MWQKARLRLQGDPDDGMEMWVPVGPPEHYSHGFYNHDTRLNVRPGNYYRTNLRGMIGFVYVWKDWIELLPEFVDSVDMSQSWPERKYHS